MSLKQKVKLDKKVVVVLGALFVLSTFALLEITGRTSVFLNRSTNTDEAAAQTTSTADTAQSDFTGGDDRQPNTNQKEEGTATDQGGNITSIPAESQWTASQDGQITAYSPTKNQIINSGQVISGTAKFPTVSFRLIDDASGVIIQGSLNVVDGRFSGNLNFKTSGINGRLDLFNSAADGTESSNIEIPVRFK